MNQITELRIEGMSCANCVKHVRTALMSVPGVENAEVSLDEKRATVRHTGVETAALVAAVEEEGYTASPGE